MKIVSRMMIVATILSSATPALAHPGHEDGGLVAGVLHPLTGADHLAAMIMVGLWAGLIAGRALWLLPASFLSAMLAGFGFGALTGGSGSGGMEMAIVASVLVLGAAVALKLRMPLAVAGAAVAVFGFAHGMAHGLEAPAGDDALRFAVGFVAATALLHGAGMLVARHMPPALVRVVGLAGAGFGLILAGAA